MSSDLTAAFPDARSNSVRGSAKAGTDREQISLDLFQHRAQVLFH